MPVDVAMPRLSDSMEEGVVLRWLVEPGQQMTPGTPVAEIEVDMATSVYEAEITGVLVETVAAQGQTLAVGATIARVEPAADAGPSREAPVGGVKGAPEIAEPNRGQRTAARRMAESKATAPDFTLEVDVDMTLCGELRARLARSAGDDPAPTAADMVVKAAALAARDHPSVNAAYRDASFERYPAVNVGIAVTAGDAVVTPVIRRADSQSLGEIARQRTALAARAADGSITSPELSGSTLTVFDLGDHGIDRFTAILQPPQAAILATGAVRRRPGVDDRGRVAARDMLTITMTCDARILFGAEAARFLAHVREALEDPVALAR